MRIDAALEAPEADTPRLTGSLDKRFGRSRLEPGKLGELVDLISTIGFVTDGQGGRRAKDLLGEVYGYFLGQFACAEGKKGGQFCTPAPVVKVLARCWRRTPAASTPPCCGSGGMFVQSEKFIEAHGGRADDISIYGQEANPTTWRLVAMDLDIRGFAADLGRGPADTFHRDQHPDLRADHILANPPFNISDWGGERLADDRRWAFGAPPAGNANHAWLQHILDHPGPRGQAGVVLANGSMSSNQNNEGAIRKAMVEADVVDVVDVMVARPPQLFFNTQIPACLWFLARDKSGAAAPGGRRRRDQTRDRRGEVLFVDARELGRMGTRVTRVFDDEDVARIATTVHRCRDDGESDGEAGTGEPHADVPGFCRAVALAEIAEHGHVLTPGRHVGAEAAEDDDEAFNEKMERLTARLAEQRAKGAKLDAVIRGRLGELAMPSEWQQSTLGAVASLVTKGTTPTTVGHAFRDAGINFVKVESTSADGRSILALLGLGLAGVPASRTRRQ